MATKTLAVGACRPHCLEVDSGLKIQWALRPCEFDSRLRHQANRALRGIWAPFLLISPDVSRITCCDRVYERPSGRPRVSDPATYCASTPRIQPPAVARWHALLHGLTTAIRETSGLCIYILVLQQLSH